MNAAWNEFIGIFKETRKHLMTGVSYMLPFVVAGGVILAASVALFGEGGVPTEGTLLNDLFNIGAQGLFFMVPILSAYIAFSIADRSGIAPGAIGGAIASSTGAGFLGGIVSGLLAGLVCYYIKKIKLPKAFASLMPIIIIPILGTLITASFMFFVVGAPIAGVMDYLTQFLTNLSDSNKILIGIVCGLMTGFDLGGPVNKVSFTFAVATVSAGIYTYAGASAVAVCTPPLGLALATFIASRKFTVEEREAGKGAFAMGLVGITEGAIPFAANDPLRIIPATMLGSAAGAASAYMFGVTCQVAWAGLIMIPVVGNVLGFLISVAIGMAVTAGVAIALKKDVVLEAPKADDSNEELDFDIEYIS
ncbi:PTS fructose transporter subunit EIIC [Exiguobacterium sp. s189]|uniref:PTS fructose transporter subunit EIIC n=1 Tax=Exiguobacterium sp. s189 TaxID=2751263 RepID=UPI001BE6F259|nr:PTS fructose transporter subunit EIIC [Exiguobacterium sp. s189]